MEFDFGKRTKQVDAALPTRLCKPVVTRHDDIRGSEKAKTQVSS
jgi:hypothetical protein